MSVICMIQCYLRLCRAFRSIDRVYCLARLIRKSWLARNARLKLMRQVDVGFRTKNLLNLPQRIRNYDDYAALMNKHFVLLNHGVATSEQVRISLNKFRLFSGNALLSVQVPGIIDNSPVSLGIQAPRSK